MGLNQQYVQNLKTFVKKWDAENPIDVLWRKHFNIPFGSKEHFETDAINQQIWYEENEIIEKIRTGELTEENYYEEESVSNSDELHMTQEQIEDWFDEIDI